MWLTLKIKTFEKNNNHFKFCKFKMIISNKKCNKIIKTL